VYTQYRALVVHMYRALVVHMYRDPRISSIHNVKLNYLVAEPIENKMVPFGDIFLQNMSQLVSPSIVLK
jgi:hypothetical protein